MTGNGTAEIDTFIRKLQLLAFLTRQYIEDRFIEEATEKPLSFAHMNLLRILDISPGKTVGDIAGYMNVSYPAATKTIDKLVRLGLLKRREDPKDRRIAHLHLTSTGKRMVDKYSLLQREQILKVIGLFGGDDMDELNRYIGFFARAIVDTSPLRKDTCIHCGAFNPEDCIVKGNGKSCGYLDSLHIG
jgi:DNA-binding MarR family transcriptional regulator